MPIKKHTQIHPYMMTYDRRYRVAKHLLDTLVYELSDPNISMLVSDDGDFLHITFVYDRTDATREQMDDTMFKARGMLPELLDEANVIYRVQPINAISENYISLDISEFELPPVLETMPPIDPEGILTTRDKGDPKYRNNPWGKVGAGILFVCEEDDTMLLMHRSQHVDEGLTWGVPGGAVIGEGWHDWYFEKEPWTDEQLWEGAKTETWEECGSIPPNLKDSQISHIFDFTKGDFVFRDFVVTLSKAQKDAWHINIEEAKDSWENIGFGWFTLDDLPHPLHNGVRFIFQHLGVDYES